MANSPFNIIKTHLWSEVKEYTWGNLTIGRNSKSVLGNVQSSQTTKKDNKKTFASTLLTGVGNVRKNLTRHYITGISVGSTAIKKTTRLLGSITNVIASTSKYIRSFVSSLTSSVSSLATELTVLLYTIQKTVVAGINLNSNSLRKTQSIVNGHVSTIGRTGRNVVKTIKSITLGLSESVRLSLRTIMSNVSLNSASVRRLIKSLISYSVLNASTFRATSKQIITSVLNSVFFMKLITKLVNVQSYVIFTLKNNIYSTVGTLVNSYVVTVSKSAKQLKSNVVSSGMKLSTVVKQLNCNIQNIPSKLVFTARTVNAIVKGMANSLRNVPYRKLLVATVNIVYNVPPIKWADNKVRTWADLTAYRWHEFDGTFATGVWKRVFIKLDPSNTKLFSGLTNNINKNILSISTSTQSIYRGIYKSVETIALSSITVSRYIKRLFESFSSTAAAVLKIYIFEMICYSGVMSEKSLQTLKVIYKPLNVISNLSTIFGKAIVQELEVIAVHVTEIFLKVVKKSSDILSVVNSFVHEINTTRELAIQMSAVHKVKQEVIWRMGANSRGETLHMVLNETKVIELSVFDEDGTASELDGANVKFAVGGAVEKDCGIVGNKITVMIEPDDIEKEGTYDYEFRLKDIFDRVDSLIMGKVIVEPKVVSAY